MSFHINPLPSKPRPNIDVPGQQAQQQTKEPQAYYKPNLMSHIIGVAIQDEEGIVYWAAPPYRHHHLINWYGIVKNDGEKHFRGEEGFINKEKNFITRQEAFKLGLAFDLFMGQTLGNYAFSEDLWQSDYMHSTTGESDKIHALVPSLHKYITPSSTDRWFFYNTFIDINKLKKELSFLKTRVSFVRDYKLNEDKVVYTGVEGKYSDSLIKHSLDQKNKNIYFNHNNNIYLYTNSEFWSMSFGEKYCRRESLKLKPLLAKPSREHLCLQN